MDDEGETVTGQSATESEEDPLHRAVELCPKLADLAEDARKKVESVVEGLQSVLPPKCVAQSLEAQKAWDQFGRHYGRNGQHYTALYLYRALYSHMARFQVSEKRRRRVDKRLPLIRMADSHEKIGNRWHARRNLMLALCEDAVTHNGEKGGEGVHFRLAWVCGLRDEQVTKYTKQAFEESKRRPEITLFPEAILLELDQDWMISSPGPEESLFCDVEPNYVSHLRRQLGCTSGKALEQLAHYLVSCVPGFRAYRSKPTRSTELDVVGVNEAMYPDFRSELGRYFVCECKDWAGPVDYTAFAKFCRVLDSVKSRFGILFSSKGISSGDEGSKNAAREQFKVFQDRGIVIIVISEKDIEDLEAGANFVAMLRTKYEQVRLDLRTTGGG